MSDQNDRCEYCWHPPTTIEGGDRLHNDGCPTIDAAAMDEWKRGHAHGFADNHIMAWQYSFYPPAFILGWRVGKQEVDRLVDQAATPCHY
jgi:hypothetical protein